MLHALPRISPYMEMCRVSVQRQVKSFMLQPEYPLTWTYFGAVYKGNSKASCSSQNIPLHEHVSGLCTKVSQKLRALARISPYMDMFPGLCTKASQMLHALPRISPYMDMCRGSVQRQVKSFMLQPEYPLTWTYFGAVYKGNSKASCSSQNIPLHEHVSGLCTKVSQKLRALARISPYMDMFPGFVQRQVESFMFQPEYPLTWTCFGALYKGKSKASCSSQNIPLHGHESRLCTKASQKLHALARISPDMDMWSGLCTKASQKLHALARISPYIDDVSGLCTKASQMLHALARISPYMDMFRALYKGKSKASCSSQNIPLHGHVSGLCTKVSQKLHALARISPYMDMCRGSVQRQLKSFMLQPEYPLT